MGLIYIWKEEQLTWRRAFCYKSHEPGKNSKLQLKSLFVLFLKCLFILFALIKRENLTLTNKPSEILPLLVRAANLKGAHWKPTLLLIPVLSVCWGFWFNWIAFHIQSNTTVGTGSFLTWALWLSLGSLAPLKVLCLQSCQLVARLPPASSL